MTKKLFSSTDTENEIIQEFARLLNKKAETSEAGKFANLAIDHLNKAAEFFELAGLVKEADLTSQIIEDIADDGKVDEELEKVLDQDIGGEEVELDLG